MGLSRQAGHSQGAFAQMLARENTQRTFSGAMDSLPQVSLLD